MTSLLTSSISLGLADDYNAGLQELRRDSREPVPPGRVRIRGEPGFRALSLDVVSRRRTAAAYGQLLLHERRGGDLWWPAGICGWSYHDGPASVAICLSHLRLRQLDLGRCVSSLHARFAHDGAVSQQPTTNCGR